MGKLRGSLAYASQESSITPEDSSSYPSEYMFLASTAGTSNGTPGPHRIHTWKFDWAPTLEAGGDLGISRVILSPARRTERLITHGNRPDSLRNE